MFAFDSMHVDSEAIATPLVHFYKVDKYPQRRAND